MRDSRPGENLWQEWSGDGWLGKTTYYTLADVDIDHDVVRRALASAIQRDGVADTLGEAYRLLDDATAVSAYAGFVDGDTELALCDAEGATALGEQVDEAWPITLVEV